MAVEARHMSLFPPQLLGNREIMTAIDQGNGNLHNAAMAYGMAPLSGTTTDHTLLPLYASGLTDSIPAMAALKADDSGLTYSLGPISRKRSRDSSINPLISFTNTQNQLDRCGNFTFLGEDISMQIYQQQLEIDRFIENHTEKVRMEIEDTRKRNSRRIIAAAEEGIMKRLRAKEEEIVKIGNLNWALEERVKSLCVENQIWRELAQTNEATANVLRSNLEQLLTQVQEDNNHPRNAGEGGALIDDAQSCCGSNLGGERKGGQDCIGNDDHCSAKSNNTNRTDKMNRLCRNCGKDESSVLLLPCRHLCLCSGCASSINICPICKSTKNGSVQVNIC